MTIDPAIIARLDAIEQRQLQVLALLTKLTSAQGEQPPQEASGISASRRVEIIMMGYEAGRGSSGKKKTSRGARA